MKYYIVQLLPKDLEEDPLDTEEVRKVISTSPMLLVCAENKDDAFLAGTYLTMGHKIWKIGKITHIPKQLYDVVQELGYIAAGVL